MADNCVLELMQAEIDPERNDDDGFLEAATNFLKRARIEAGDEVQGYVDRYRAALEESPEKLLDAMRADQQDNYLLASFAAFVLLQEDLIDTNLPLISWAAYNKKEFKGFHGEIANLRLLILFGFDVNAQDPDTKATALHWMSNLRWHTGPHPRAMQVLLEAGADPNIRNRNGDNVLAYMAGSMPFEPMAEAFVNCLAYGGDVHSVSDDGMSVLDILKACQEQRPEEMRQALIERIELSGVEPKQRNANPRRL